MVLLRNVTEKNTSTLLQKRQKRSRKCARNRIKIYKIPFWVQGRKDNKKKTQKNTTNCTKKHPPRVSHERGFRILKCIRVGFRARWAPRPSKPRFWHHFGSIWDLFCKDFWCNVGGVFYEKRCFSCMGAHFAKVPLSG